MKIVLFIATSLIALSRTQTVDYCNKELCRKFKTGRGFYYAPHIACNNDGDFASACPAKRSLVPMTQDLITLLLHSHNQYRSDIATGKITGFKEADQMIEMAWDIELARFAELKAKTCIFEHDECRSTEQYPTPGQNLGFTWTRSDYDDVADHLLNATAGWFIEYKMCDMSYIDKYRVSSQNIGHFIQLVVAGADRVGCAMTKYDNGLRNMLVVCDYSLGTILGERIYTTGKPCSKCLSGCSESYEGLCNSNEKDYWNKQ